MPFQETVTVADENLFEIFDFPLISGDPRTALKEPNSIVINEELAMRIFNRVDVLGKSVQFNYMETTLKITGILKNHPRNSSFTFNSVMSESTLYAEDYFKEMIQSDWTSNNFSVYALLKPSSDAQTVARKLTDLVLKNHAPEPGALISYALQPLGGVHLHSEGITDGARNSNVESIPQGNPAYVTIFSITAILALLVAGINYTNLTTARASSRLKEIAVRKTVGAARGNLVRQFLVESMLTTLIAFVVAVIGVNLFLPVFNNFVNKELVLNTSVGFKFWMDV